MLSFFQQVKQQPMVPFPHHWRTTNIRINDTPRQLGIILNRSLLFNAHIKDIKQSLSSRLRAITVTAHVSWGWWKPLLRTAFHAFVHSKLGYATPAWQPWLSNTNITSLDCLQIQALRLITGQLVSTPLETLRLESGVQSYYTESKRMVVWAREKCLCTAADRPKRLALQNGILQRIVNHSSFCCKATELSTILPEELSHLQVINLLPSPPWLASPFCTNQVCSTIPGISGRNDQPTHKLHKGLEHISSYQVDYTIYTDGSASAGTRNGGAAAIISTGSPTQPTVEAPSKYRVKHSLAPMKKKLLPWKLLYSGPLQTPTQCRLPSSSARTANHYVRHSHHATLKSPTFVNAFVNVSAWICFLLPEAILVVLFLLCWI